jgi:hypothetical protein
VIKEDISRSAGNEMTWRRMDLGVSKSSANIALALETLSFRRDDA